jgi:hypothetical protein
VETILNIDD